MDIKSRVELLSILDRLNALRPKLVDQNEAEMLSKAMCTLEELRYLKSLKKEI